MKHLTFVMILAALSLCGCATNNGWLPTSGPSRTQIQSSSDTSRIQGIQMVDVNDTITCKLIANEKHNVFSESLGASSQPGYAIGLGDVVEVTIWEAPPATLFVNSDTVSASVTTSAHATILPDQMVCSDGTITVPFAGKIDASRRSPEMVEKEIEQRLQKKAHQPQVLVRVIHNNSAYVTVVGEVNSNVKMPLTSGGEKLLDALAVAGGVKQPINKLMVQITRGQQVYSMPLDTVIRDLKQNIPMQAKDVLTLLYQPFSFTVMGATIKNAEIDFEAQGISLAQALTRAGGLLDGRADAKGIFIFRLEDPSNLDLPAHPTLTPDGKVPVVYSVDMKDPASFFVAQKFPVKNKDLIYVSNAPAAELQKFLNIVGSIASPVLSMGANAATISK